MGKRDHLKTLRAEMVRVAATDRHRRLIAGLGKGRAMKRTVCVLAVASILAQPVIAGEPSDKAQRNREISEIVFQNYPPRALAAGEQGPVFFVVTLDKDARAMSCEVTHGSGHPLLDDETCELILMHAVFKSAKDAQGHVIKQTAEGVVNWTIPGRAPEPFKPVLLTGKDKPEKQICRKNLRMGTLSSVERICMTPTEWAKQADEMKENWREMQTKGYTVGNEGLPETKCAGGSFRC
jgi:periplasmic protein TonB